MMKRLFILCCVFSSFIGITKAADDHLLISEVFLDANNRQASWIEIYNPTDENLYLQKFRYSHVKVLNLIPASSIPEGGILVLPQQAIVLCADTEVFKSKWANVKSFISVPALAVFTTKGFFVIKTQNRGNWGNDFCSYGAITNNNKNNFKNKINVSFVKESKSYSKKISTDGNIEKEFFTCTPTPGEI